MPVERQYTTVLAVSSTREREEAEKKDLSVGFLFF
jgi:hypothetical protein